MGGVAPEGGLLVDAEGRREEDVGGCVLDGGSDGSELSSGGSEEAARVLPEGRRSDAPA